MFRTTLAALFVTVASTVHAQSERPISINAASCGVFLIYLDHPEVMREDIFTFFDTIVVGLELSGVDLERFWSDYGHICTVDPNLKMAVAVQQVAAAQMAGPAD